MAREKRKWEVDDGTTDEAKRQSRGAFSIPSGLPVFRGKRAGTMRLSILPFLVTISRDKFVESLRRSKKVGVLFPHRIYWVHYGVGPNKETVACPYRNFGHKCPICEERTQFLERPDGESKEIARGLNAKERQAWLVFDHDEDYKGLQIWPDVSIHCFGNHISEYVDGFRSEKERARYRRYYDPDEGLILNVNCKEESSGSNKFTDFLVHSMSPREEPLSEEILERARGIDLDSLVTQEQYPRIKQMFKGGLGDDEEETEEGDPDPEVVPPPKKEDKPASLPFPPKSKGKESPREDGKPWIPCSRDKVGFEWKGQDTQGEIQKVDLDSKMVHVKIEGSERVIKLEFSDLTLIKSDDTFDLPSTKDDWDDDEDKMEPGPDPVPPSRKKTK